MSDRGTYEKYDIALVDQMQVLESAVNFLHQTVEEAKLSGTSQEFINEIQELIALLAGEPGDAALEVYENIDRDIKKTKEFIAYWSGKSQGDQIIIETTMKTYRELTYFKYLVDQTPPYIIAEIKSNITISRTPKQCFVATVVYGDDCCLEVNTLRDIRDNVLSKNILGVAFIQCYYNGLGKSLAQIIKNSAPFLIPLIKALLNFIVKMYQMKSKE